MTTQPFAGGIDLVPGPQGPPVPANGLRLVTIGQALHETTDGITFTAVGGGGGVASDPTSGVVSTSLGSNPDVPSGITVDAISANGTADETLALRNWLASVPAGAGADIKLPTGTIKVTGPILSNGQNGVSLHSRGRNTVIKADDSGGNFGNVLEIKNSSDCQVYDLTIDAVSQRSAGWGLAITGGNAALPIANGYVFARNGVSIRRVNMHNQFGGITFQDDTVTPLGNWISYLDECVAYNCTGDAFFLNSAKGASHFISRMFAYNNPIVGGTNAGVHVVGSGDFNFRECEVFGYPYGLLINPTGSQLVLTGRFAKCFFDTASIRTGYIDGTISTVGDIDFEGCWFATSLEHGMLISGTGATDIRFRGTQFVHNANYGLVYNGVKYITADANCTFAANLSGGVLFTGSSTHCAVRGCTGRSTSPIANATQPNGVQLNAGCDYAIVTMNDFHDTTSGIVDNSGGAHNILTPNIT